MKGFEGLGFLYRAHERGRQGGTLYLSLQQNGGPGTEGGDPKVSWDFRTGWLVLCEDWHLRFAGADILLGIAIGSNSNPMSELNPMGN